MEKKLFFIFFLFVQLTFANTPEPTVRQFNKKFKEILIDVRDSRNGNGDVAAGYLTAMDMIQNYSIESTITLLVDSESRIILNRLARGNSKFAEAVKIEYLDTLPNNKVFDFYLALASQSAHFYHEKDIIEMTGTDFIRPEISRKINIRINGVLITQTVFGNTESTVPDDSPKSLAVVRSHGINYHMSHAGIGSNEAGIYNDYVASGLRNQNETAIARFVLEGADTIEDSFSRHSINYIISENKLKGAKVGLVYGISLDKTKSQFMSYLDGLAAESSRSFCLITPSQFDEKDIIDPVLKSKVRFISNLYQLPEIAEVGKIYVVKTKTLPHRIFVGLMAHSMKQGLPPVGAGDSFISAAINLGGPFVLTRVGWNYKNIENLKNIMLELARRSYPDPKDLASVETELNSVFGQIDLKKALSLQALSPLFLSLREAIPDLTERIMNAAVMVSSEAEKGSKEFHYSRITDPILKRSVMDINELPFLESLQNSAEKQLATRQCRKVFF